MARQHQSRAASDALPSEVETLARDIYLALVTGAVGSARMPEHLATKALEDASAFYAVLARRQTTTPSEG